MDNTLYYVIGLFAFIIFLVISFNGTDQEDNRPRARRNYSRNYGNRSGRYTSRRRHNVDYDRNDNYDNYDDYDQIDDDYNQHYRGSNQRHYRRLEQESGGVGLFIAIAALLLIGYGIYRYNESQPAPKTEIAKAPLEDSIQKYTDLKTDPVDVVDTETDYSLDNYPNNSVDSSIFDYDVGLPDYYPQEYKDLIESNRIETNPTPVEVGIFNAQTGAFGVLENANQEKQKWLNQGYTAKVVVLKNNDGLFRVIVGGYFSEIEAKAFMGKKYDQVYELEGDMYYEVK